MYDFKTWRRLIFVSAQILFFSLNQYKVHIVSADRVQCAASVRVVSSTHCHRIERSVLCGTRFLNYVHHLVWKIRQRCWDTCWDRTDSEESFSINTLQRNTERRIQSTGTQRFYGTNFKNNGGRHITKAIPLHLLSYLMEQSPTWEANWFCS